MKLCSLSCRELCQFNESRSWTFSLSFVSFILVCSQFVLNAVGGQISLIRAKKDYFHLGWCQFKPYFDAVWTFWCHTSMHSLTELGSHWYYLMWSWSNQLFRPCFWQKLTIFKRHTVSFEAIVWSTYTISMPALHHPSCRIWLPIVLFVTNISSGLDSGKE